MKLPDDAPVPIVDPFVSFMPKGQTSLDVPMPRDALRDDESVRAWPSSDMTGHLFRKDPDWEERKKILGDFDRWLANLDRWQIHHAQVPLPSDLPNEVFDRLVEHADRISVSVRANPHDGMRVVRRIEELASTYPNVRSVSISPFMTYPLIAPSEKEYYPIYAKCVERDLAVFINVGFPGPRVPAQIQDPIHLDEVCWFFPDLHVVMRHGGAPWIETCVQMLLRWPNLWYATTAYAPRYYPQPIIDLLNKRGRGKIVWAGYWPMLPYERVFGEIAELPIKDDAWPDFLANNAIEAFRLPRP